MPASPFESVEAAFTYLRRVEGQRRIRAEDDITALMKAVEHGYAVARSVRLAFLLLDTVDPVLDLRSDDLDPRQLAHEDPVLGTLAGLGRVCWAYVSAFRKVLDEAPTLRPAASQLREFLASHGGWLNLQKTLVSDGQMICVAVDQTAKALGIPRVEPQELEALAVAAGIRPQATELTDEGRSADAWKKLLMKARDKDEGLARMLSMLS